MSARLSIIVVNWNTREALDRCLESVRRHAPAEQGVETLVVDNGSSDGSPRMVAERFPEMRLLANPENEGFARANNRGLREASGRALLLLNSDTEVGAESLQTLLAYLDEHPEVGAVGGRLVLPDGSVQRSASTHISPHTIRCEQLMLDRLFPRSRRYAGHFYLPQDYRSAFAAQVLSGACLMLRREVYEGVGPLDERFFMYCEDADWCRRFAEAGWALSWVPTPPIRHALGGSSTRVRGDLVAAYNRSKCYYLLKWEGLASAEEARRLSILGARLRLGLRTVGALARGRRPATDPAVRLWRDVLGRTQAIDCRALPTPPAEAATRPARAGADPAPSPPQP